MKFEKGDTVRCKEGYSEYYGSDNLYGEAGYKQGKVFEIDRTVSGNCAFAKEGDGVYFYALELVSNKIIEEFQIY